MVTVKGILILYIMRFDNEDKHCKLEHVHIRHVFTD